LSNPRQEYLHHHTMNSLSGASSPIHICACSRNWRNKSHQLWPSAALFQSQPMERRGPSLRRRKPVRNSRGQVRKDQEPGAVREQVSNCGSLARHSRASPQAGVDRRQVTHPAHPGRQGSGIVIRKWAVAAQSAPPSNKGEGGAPELHVFRWIEGRAAVPIRG